MWIALYWHPVQGRLSYSCHRQHGAKAARTTGRGQGAWVGHPRNRVSPLPDGCAGSHHLPCATSPWGRQSPEWRIRMVLAAKRCNGTASFAMIKHTKALMASGSMATLVPGCVATTIVKTDRGCKRPHSCPKKEKWQSCHYRPPAKVLGSNEGCDAHCRPMADPSSGTVMHPTSRPTEKLRCP